VHLILFLPDLPRLIGISNATTVRNLATGIVNAEKGFVGIIKHQAPSHKAATVTHIDTSDMSYTNVALAPQSSTLSPAEIEALIHQVLSKSTLNTAMSTTPGNSSWYIDSICCNHMTPNSSIFSTKFVLPRPTTIYIANGSHLNVSHTGSVSTHQLSMSDTYLMPNLSLNLLSVGELGLELHFSKRGCDV
jgi:hypothetical protein